MGENSKIEWTDHTFNPWIGCTKVSPGCANCYAERDMERYGKAKWGAGQPRVRTAASTWAQPLKWDRAAAKAGVRAKVFCASLADVFDHEVPVAWLSDLFDLIDRCRNLDWLLLTKLPGRFHERVGLVFEYHLDGGGRGPDLVSCWIAGMPPSHVWLGTTVEDQQRGDERIPHLLNIPARVRFLSCEPLLGMVDLRLDTRNDVGRWDSTGRELPLRRIDWIICGGESGPSARPMPPAWARSLRDQAHAASVPFLFKQWGEYDQAGHRVGKHAAGRCLDGRTHDERPCLANAKLTWRPRRALKSSDLYAANSKTNNVREAGREVLCHHVRSRLRFAVATHRSHR